MASYQGSPFEAGIGPTDNDIVLFAACPPPEELGFEPATGHWRKQLPIADVQAVCEYMPVGLFRSERCMVLDDLGDRLHIGYLGHDGYKAEQLGYWQVDRGVFELVAPKTEVSEILEERTDYPRGTATGGRANGQLVAEPGYPQSSADSILPRPQAGLSGPHQTQSGQHAITSAYLDSRGDTRAPLETAAPATPGSYLLPPGPELYPREPAAPQRGYPDVPSYPAAEAPVTTGSLGPLAYRPVVDNRTGVAL